MTIIPSIRIYVNKVEDRITFKIKTGYYLQFLIPKTLKLVRITWSKIKKKNENHENVSYLEINEVVLSLCNIVNNNYQQNSRFFDIFVPNTSIIRYITQKFDIL